jgi:dolichyl-phosphate-mannose-protein mannosyltransferase
MSAADYLEGIAFFVPTLVAALAGAWLLLAKRFGHLAGAARVVAYGQLAVLGVLAVHLAPAALGVLARGTVVVAALLWLGAAWLVPDVDAERALGRPSRPIPSAGRVTTILTALGAILLAVYVVAVTRSRLVLPPAGVDVLAFHLPTVASWIKEGTIWQIPVFLPNVSPGHYPNNGDILLLATILPWRNDFLAHLAMYPVYGLTGVAVYALARELATPRAAAVMAALLVLAMPAVSVPALVVDLVDILMLFGLGTGVLFLIRHHRQGRTSDLVLGGLALGVSFGTKWYGVSCVAIAVAVWAVASLGAGRRLAAVARAGAALAALIALSGGIWLLRNLVESGNPAHPVKVQVLGMTLFDAPRDIVRERGGFTIADYIGDSQAWSDFILPQLGDALGLAGAVLLGALLAGGGVALARRLRRRVSAGDGLVLAGSVCGILMVGVYTITPYTAGGARGQPFLVGADARYVVPALLIAAPIAAWAAGRVRWGAPAFAALGLLAVLNGVQLTSEGARSSAYLSGRDWTTGVVGIALLAAAARAAPWAGERLRSSPRMRLAAVATAGLAAVVLVGVGHAMQQRFNDDRYVGADPTLDWIARNAPTGHRIGLAGLWSEQGISPVTPAFGPRFGNDVAYVGKLVEDTLNRYPSRATFARAVELGDFDYLIVGRGRPGVATPPERRWARASGFELVVESERLSLFRVRRPGRA